MIAAASLPPRAALWLAGVSALFLAGAAVLVALDDGVRPALGAKARSGPTARSTSALGYGAFVELLEALRVPVIVSADGAGKDTRADAVPVLLEPRAGRVPDAALDSARSARASLVVVPKWDWKPDAWRPDWVGSVALLPTGEAMRAVDALIPSARLVRPGRVESWRSRSFRHRPTLAEPQLIVSDRLQPVIAGDAGILLGRLDGGAHVIWVLSDPDLLSNHGIGQGDNALLAAGIADLVRAVGAPLLFDETVHGTARSRSLWRSFLEPPLVGLTAVFLATGLLLAWAALRRFGSTLAEEPPIARGATALIESTTDLLCRYGAPADLLERYAGAVFREAEAAIAGPHRGSQPDLGPLLDEAASRAGIRPGSALREDAAAAVGAARASPQAVVRFAATLHQWKEELLHGPGRRKRPVRRPEA